ncbi:ankyrin repeat domain-containing protein [Thermodesulfobacteriota bacterium]
MRCSSVVRRGALSFLAFVIILMSVSVSYAMTKEEALKELEKMGINLDNPSFIGTVKQGKLNLIKVFLDAGMDPNSRDRSEGATVLMMMTKKGNTKVVKMLVDAGADVNAVNNSGDTALLTAVSANKNDIVELLLKGGADTTLLNEKNETALHVAARTGNAVIIKTLLDAGVDINMDAKGITPIMLAGISGNDNAIKLFLDKSKNDDVKLKGLSRALFNAVNVNSIKGVKLFLDFGADPSAYKGNEDKYRSPVISATVKDYNDIVKLLVDAGANVNHLDRYNESVLMIAFEKRKMVAAKIIFTAKDLDVNVNVDGQTLLHYVVSDVHKEDGDELAFIKLLLEKTPDLDIERDKDDRTPLEIAKDRKLSKVIKLLEDAGAKQ